MNYLRILPLLLLAATLHGQVMKNPELDYYPDTVILNDGTTLHGLIVRSDEEILTLQQRKGEKDIPKKYVSRIIDDQHEKAYFADIVDPNTLPPWRMIVQDLRSDDNIHTFRQVPATTIDSGYLRNIPYLSFKINNRVEMNVYGNPENPVCIEFGIYERNREEIDKFERITRTYLAGILSSRAEVKGLYSLPDTGGDIRVKKMAFKVLPPTASDAYGGWWISEYRPDALDAARVSDAEYAKVTLPFDQVNNKDGELRSDTAHRDASWLTATKMNFSSMMPDLRGFYRNSMGELQPLLAPFSKTTNAPSQQ